MRRLVVALLAAVALIVPLAATATASSPTVTGLWASDYQTTPSTYGCGPGSLDSNGFCAYAGGSPVALGVKFTTSAPVMIWGVRAYRVDPGTVTGALWTADGTRLATGTFDAYSGTDGWQDLVFSTPVAITPGHTYVASYYVQSAYAYAYHYFGTSGLTVGPITALQAAASDPNGVYCFSGASCFPANGYLDTNYWVTPLWVGPYTFTGFFSPISMTGTNVVRAGSAVPVKFSLGGDQGLNIFAPGYPKMVQTACETGETGATVETVTAGSSSLSYDPTSNQYAYVWKTQSSWSGDCGQLVIEFADGSTQSASFQFK